MIPIELQVIGASLRAIAEEMGAVLIRSAFSANIKERRDCSTALFDERGRMVTQAEHIPVHLGAMPDAVAAVMSRDPGCEDVFILNDPFAGGTHLPDITFVSRTDVGLAVTRAHHADVGGVEPGSMPAASRTLEEEGVVIAPTRLGPETLGELAVRMRNPDERMGDFRAQLAAHRLADERVAELCARHGPDGVRAAMDELLAYSERIVRAGIARLPDGRFEASDVLEAPGGTLTIRAAVTVAGDEVGGVLRRALLDRTGRARLRRRFRARQRRGATGLARQRPPRSCGRGGQRRDLLPDRRRALPRARP